MRFAFLAVLVMVSAALVSAGFGEMLNNLCVQVRGLMPIVAFTLLIFAGLMYAAGQVLGAEMRSRTNVWATTMAIGAVLGLIIAASAPVIISLIMDAFGEGTAGYEYTCEYMM